MPPTLDLSSPDLGVNFTSTVHHDTYPTIDPATNQNQPAWPRSVLITGAAKGIGRATAIAYAKSGAARIAVSARVLREAEAICAELVNEAKRVGRPEPQTLALQIDVCDRRSINAAASTIQKAWKRLDILINNAAYLAPFVPLADGDESEWWYTWEVNIRGVYWVTKALLPLLLQAGVPGDKTVINVSSIGALALTPGASAYNPSKTALTRFTEFLMVDHQDQGLLSYSVHPASVATNLAKRMPGYISNGEFVFFCVTRQVPIRSFAQGASFFFFSFFSLLHQKRKRKKKLIFHSSCINRHPRPPRQHHRVFDH